MDGKNVLGEIDPYGDNAHVLPLRLIDENDSSHLGIFDAVCGNFAATSGRGSPFHSLCFIVKLTAFEEKVVEHILKSSAPGKHAARSALRHLERAWKLVEEMPELAMFSAITAEEESATALFHALKRRRYKGAQKLNPRSHLHKTALHPFLLAVGKLFAEVTDYYSPLFEFNSDLSPDGAERLRLRLTVHDGTGKPWWAYTTPPLEFNVSVNDVVHRFEPELAQLATEKNAATALEYVQKLSNRRNLAIYAAPNGIPHVDGSTEPFLIYRKSVVFSHLLAVLLIEPYSQQQAFVQQSIAAFLSMLKAMPEGCYET